MSRTIPEVAEGGSLYDVMLKHSLEARWFVVTPWLVSQSQAVPAREELIADFMSIATYTPTKDARGHAQFGEPHWPTRREAERAVDACLGREILAA